MLAATSSPRKHLKTIVYLFNFLWTALFLGAFFWIVNIDEKEILGLVEVEAKASFDKDLLYRRWAAGHGGVYVPVTDRTQPNPYLKDIPERDIFTQSGRKLTLINPAYMTRQVYELSGKISGVKAHITSLDPLRPKNRPDEWEKSVLLDFEKKIERGASIEQIGGEAHLRYMGQLVTESGCLKCHSGQGYKEGDIRGGISISVPLLKYQEISSERIKGHSQLLLLMWSIGLLLFNFGGKYLRKQILAREQIEKDLSRSEKQYRAIFEHVGDYILILEMSSDGTCVIVDANQSAAEKHGYSLEELVGQPISLIDREVTPELVSEKLQELSSNEQLLFETLHYRKDGSTFPVEVSVTLFKNPVDKKTMFISAERDITERKEADEKMGEIEEISRLAFYTSPDSITINKIDGIYVEVNQGFMDLTGYSRTEVIGKNSTDINIWGVPADRKRLVAGLQREGRVSNLESCFRLKDGSFKYGLMSAAIIKLKGEPHIISITRDIDELKKSESDKFELERQLQQAQKMESLGRLTGGVAHDFNNILSVITGYAEMTLEEIESSDPIYRNLEKILDAALRSADIVRQLLAFSRQQSISPRLLDLNESVEGMLKMLRRLIGENIELVWSPYGGLATIEMDPSQIDQILANLCVNARDAIDGNGRITMSTKMVIITEVQCLLKPYYYPGRFVQLIVSDDGSGINPEHVDKIFEPFFTSKEVGKGTGLGLATVYGIVKQNKGFIEVASEKNVGTTFTIHLPACDSILEESTGKKTANVKTGKGETILIVEDDLQLLEMTLLVLKSLNYRVLVASSPSEAIKIVSDKSNVIDLILTDVVMPELSGKELATLLKSENPDIRILYMSGYTNDEISTRGVLADGIQFLGKPFSRYELAQKIDEVLNR